jgi:hypothetical protein
MFNIYADMFMCQSTYIAISVCLYREWEDIGQVMRVARNSLGLSPQATEDLARTIAGYLLAVYVYTHIQTIMCKDIYVYIHTYIYIYIFIFI